MLHNEYERFDDAVLAERPKTSIGTTVALVVIVLALVGAMFLLVRAGTDGIDADPVVTTVVDAPGATDAPTGIGN